MKKAIYLLGFLLVGFWVQGVSADASDLYRDNCAGCHGAGLDGGLGPSLIDAQWHNGETDEDLTRVIRDGVSNGGMPAFGGTLSDREIHSLVALIRERSSRQAPTGTGVGRTLEGEALNDDLSRGYERVTSEEDAELEYVGYFDISDYICYADIDLTGVRSIVMEYAKAGSPGRFALMAYNRQGSIESAINLGEKVTPVTGEGEGGWEAFTELRVGLSQPMEGRHHLCFVGVDGGGIFNMDRFTLSDRPGENDGTTPFEILEDGISFEIPSTTVTGAGHRFTLERIGEGPGDLWAMDFLPDGTLAVTQKDGKLWLFRDGERRGPVQGTPEVAHEGQTQGGLLGVTAHPDYADNGWLYLTYAEPGEEEGTSMTRVVRGRLDGLRWVDEQTIYAAPARYYTDSNYHFGSRLVFADGYIYFGIGDRGHRDGVQDLSDPRGKIYRLHEDGRIPEDNPFVEDEGALGGIWSYGHRNPQGMTRHPETGEVWSAEHGPLGGDEINRIRKGLNYGWPLVSHGTNYDGTIISEEPHREGIESPVHHWTPSIGVSNLEFYAGNRFPRWHNHLLVGSLADREVRLVRIEDQRAVEDEVLLTGLGRVRDVRSGPDGYPYILFGNPNGVIYRLVPVDEL